MINIFFAKVEYSDPDDVTTLLNYTKIYRIVLRKGKTKDFIRYNYGGDVRRVKFLGKNPPIQRDIDVTETLFIL